MYLLYIALGCTYVCLFETYLLRNGWIALKKSFLLVPSWSGEGFRPKKFSFYYYKIVNKMMNFLTKLNKSEFARLRTA